MGLKCIDDRILGQSTSSLTIGHLTKTFKFKLPAVFTFSRSGKNGMFKFLGNFYYKWAGFPIYIKYLLTAVSLALNRNQLRKWVAHSILSLLH